MSATKVQDENNIIQTILNGNAGRFKAPAQEEEEEEEEEESRVS